MSSASSTAVAQFEAQTPALYTGGVQGVVFDWAGTLCDFGSTAPVAAFVEVFRRYSVTITAEQARRPMGAHKREHIEALLADPEIAARFVAAHGRESTEADVDAMYRDFVPVQVEHLPEHVDLIPGVLDTIAWLRARGIAVGTCTGYTREMVDVAVSRAKALGFIPDYVTCAGEVERGRPHPDMCLANALALGVSAVQSVVKVDDTATGIVAGLRAGMWTVAVVVSGNAVGLSAEAWAALTPDEQQSRREAGYAAMRASGAHYMVDSVADLPAVVEDIGGRLARGERP